MPNKSTITHDGQTFEVEYHPRRYRSYTTGYHLDAQGRASWPGHLVGDIHLFREITGPRDEKWAILKQKGATGWVARGATAYHPMRLILCQWVLVAATWRWQEVARIEPGRRAAAAVEALLEIARNPDAYLGEIEATWDRSDAQSEERRKREDAEREEREKSNAEAARRLTAYPALEAENARMRAFIERVVSDAGASVGKGDKGEPVLMGGLDPAILMDEFLRHGRKALRKGVE